MQLRQRASGARSHQHFLSSRPSYVQALEPVPASAEKRNRLGSAVFGVNVTVTRER
ncbi:MAG: hypothetical protein NZL87_03295 [Thermomicrobium sp.]|nr:hypothetical protein [Thermomicrobium sp.]